MEDSSRQSRATRAQIPQGSLVQSRKDGGSVVYQDHDASDIGDPFLGMSNEEKTALDLRDYGFHNVKIPMVAPSMIIPPPRLPTSETFICQMMALMQNKIFYLREHFVVEAKELMWIGMEKRRTSKAEQMMLEEAADPNKLLSISRRAQDCIRLILYYDALIMQENETTGKRTIENDQYLREERFMNLYNRSIIWDKLKLEIAGQLPGNKRTRERCADSVLHGALDLVSDGCHDNNDHKN